MLNTKHFGDDTPGTPLVIAHGLFGSGRNWGVIAKRMSERRPVITVDMRNHGASFWSDDMSYEAMSADLAEVITPLGESDLLGHSMGGKASMMAALNGAPIRRLIVADIAPVGYGHTQAHFIDAMEALNLSEITSRGQADAALMAHVEDSSTRAFLLQSIEIKSQSWNLNLTALRAEMPKIIGFPNVSSSFSQPTFFISGGASDYVTPEARPRIRELFPKARFAKIPGAGHWLHAEKPREFEASVTAFLDAV